MVQLIRVAKELRDNYPPYRDDPSEDDLRAWQELDDAIAELEREMPSLKPDGNEVR